MDQELLAQRQALAETEYDLYSSDSFPGSKTWRQHNAALVALRDFDAAHPEIIAEIKRARAISAHTTAQELGWI